MREVPDHILHLGYYFEKWEINNKIQGRKRQQSNIDLNLKVLIFFFFWWKTGNARNAWFLKRDFKEQFQVHSKISQKVSIFPLFSQNHPLVSPTVNIPHQRGPSVTTDEPTLTHHDHPKPIVHIRVCSWCCTLILYSPVWTTELMLVIGKRPLADDLMSSCLFIDRLLSLSQEMISLKKKST